MTTVRLHLAAIGDMTLAMSQATSADEIFREALRAIGRVTGATRAAVLLFDPDGVMRFEASEGLSAGYCAAVEGHTPWKPGQSHPEPILVRDVAEEPSLRPLLGAIEAEGIRAMMMIPLVTGGGTIGKFMVYFGVPVLPDADVIALVQNIAAHTAFAVDRQRVVEALQASEARYRSIVEPLRDVVFQADATGRWVFLNPAWSEITGHPLAGSLGRAITEYVHPDDHGLVRDQLRALVDGAPSVRFECRFVTPNGAVRWLEVSAYPPPRVGSPTIGVGGTMTDVTDRKATSEASREAEARLREAQRLEGLGVLAGGIAHDFNNLLVGVLSNAALALEGLPEDSTTYTVLRDMEVAGRRAAELTRQLLAYSGKGRFVVQPLDLAELVRDSAGLLRAAVTKKATLTYRFAADLPAIEGDPTQLRQVAMNLLVNASDALGDRPGTIDVWVEKRQVDAATLARASHGRDLPPGEYVALEVRDSGTGMSPTTTARMFDPFYTTKFQGRGLGLAAVLGIVRGHHGAILVESTLDQGTSMVLLFPAQPRAATSKAPSMRSSSTEGGTPRGNVLVVDDEELVRRVTQRALQHAGYAVALAADGQKALTFLRAGAQRVDLVLLDLTMPELSGKETLAQIRATWPRLPVVLMSGYTAEAAQLDEGDDCTSFLQKPFTQDELLATLTQALAPHHAARS